jgi:glycerol-3-phosphate acyltransferase PlsY
VPTWQPLAAALAAYLLGCFSAAYYLVRLAKGQDIRELGSGTAGGRNAGRVLGRPGFVAVVLLDGLKGLLAVLLARWLGVQGWWLVPALLAVVAGHIWPAQLGFHGGKGIATTIGALLAYNYLSVAALAALFLAGYALTRSATLGLMLAFVLLPLALLALGQPPDVVVALALLAALVIYANRSNIRARLPGRSAKAP